MNLDNIVIVLAHPEESRNIGAVCRAMANNDLHELRIVGARDDYNDEHVKRLAIHAAPIWERTRFFDSITAATADCVLAAGTTRRRGKKRKGKLLLPEELAHLATRVTGMSPQKAPAPVNSEFSSADHAQDASIYARANDTCTPCRSVDIDSSAAFDNIGIACNDTKASDGTKSATFATGGKVAVVFGNERTGLTDEELLECTTGVIIPSSADFASLNLSHAVQIIAYHLFREQKQVSPGSVPVTLSRLDITVTRIADSLQKIGFFTVTGRSDMERFWRMVLSRAALSEGEVTYIETVFDKAAGLASKHLAN